MPTCNNCGDEIEFRYIDGSPKPIHVNGGWCSGYNSDSRQTSTQPFESVLSYVNPNAHCPVCGEKVYFYQSPFDGRVFFDDLGWPWPKHRCTDVPRAQSGTVKPLTRSFHKTFRSSHGESRRLYQMVELTEQGDSIFMKLNELDKPLVVLRMSVPLQTLRDGDVTVKDLQSAPSFVVRFYDDHRLLEFISGRKRQIDRLRVPRTNMPG